MIPKSKRVYDHFNKELRPGQYIENMRFEDTYGKIVSVLSHKPDYHIVTYANRERGVFETCDNSSMLRILSDEEVMMLKLAGKI